jgi:hypothetical protein
MLLDQTLNLQERWQQLPLVLLYYYFFRFRGKGHGNVVLVLFPILNKKKKLPQLVARDFEGCAKWHRVTHLDSGDGVCESLATKEGFGVVLSFLDALFNVSLCVLHAL